MGACASTSQLAQDDLDEVARHRDVDRYFDDIGETGDCVPDLKDVGTFAFSASHLPVSYRGGIQKSPSGASDGSGASPRAGGEKESRSGGSSYSGGAAHQQAGGLERLMNAHSADSDEMLGMRVGRDKIGVEISVAATSASVASGSEKASASPKARRKEKWNFNVPRRLTPFARPETLKDQRPPEPSTLTLTAPPFESILEASRKRVERHKQEGLNKDNQELLNRFKALAKKRGAGIEDDGSSVTRRDSGGSASQKLHTKGIPDAPLAMAKLVESAIATNDAEFANSDAVQALLADDIVYKPIDGDTAEGRQAATDSLNDGLKKVCKRMMMSTLKGDASTLKQVRTDLSGPKRTDDETWVVDYVFTVMLIKIKVREEYTIDAESGRITKLVRTKGATSTGMFGK